MVKVVVLESCALIVETFDAGVRLGQQRRSHHDPDQRGRKKWDTLSQAPRSKLRNYEFLRWGGGVTGSGEGGTPTYHPLVFHRGAGGYGSC